MRLYIMNYTELFQSLMFQLGYKPTAQAIADIIGIKKHTVYTRSQRLEQKFSLEELLKIEQALNVKLVDENFKFNNFSKEKKIIKKKSPDELGQNLKEHSHKIMYWSECERFGNLLKKPSITEWVTDLQGIVLDWGANPENLCIIAMPGEEMDNGGYPIRNNDILIVDMSRKNITESGIYFYSTLNGTKVFVRRLLEQMHGDVTVTVDNPRYAPIVNKTFSQKELDEINFTVIGRVIKNMSIKL